VLEAVRPLGEIAEAGPSRYQAGNVMLSGRHAMVMDFGAAGAVTDAAAATSSPRPGRARDAVRMVSCSMQTHSTIATV
jgi:hypothetical protein